MSNKIELIKRFLNDVKKLLIGTCRNSYKYSFLVGTIVMIFNVFLGVVIFCVLLGGFFLNEY